MRDVTERLARMNLDAVDAMLERGVDIINVCDDLGTADALILSPELIRGFFFPWYDELVSRVHAKGAHLHLHSHGNIRELLPDFTRMGVDILNPFDWEENPDLPDLVGKHSRDFIFCGGTTGALHDYSVEEVREIVQRACDLSSLTERGYILLARRGDRHAAARHLAELDGDLLGGARPRRLNPCGSCPIPCCAWSGRSPLYAATS